MTAADAFVAGLRATAEPLLADPPGGSMMGVLMPVDLDPFERHYRFGIMLDAELRVAGVGSDCGGGTLYAADEEHEDDPDAESVFTVIEIDATDVDAARAVLRLHLPELGCPAGTMIHFGDDREDLWDGQAWHIGGARSLLGWE